MTAVAATLENGREAIASQSEHRAPGIAKSVLAALGDEFSERIVISVVDHSRTAEEISALEGIPLSTCYRRIRELVDSGMLLVERIVITKSGRRFALYRSCFSSFQISFGSNGVDVRAELNQEVADKVRNRQLLNSFADHQEGMQ